MPVMMMRRDGRDGRDRDGRDRRWGGWRGWGGGFPWSVPYTVPQYVPQYYYQPSPIVVQAPSPPVVVQAPPSGSAGWSGPGLYRVAAQRLNVRTGPDGVIVDQLSLGTRVNVFPQSIPLNGWVQIDSPAVGYVQVAWLDKLLETSTGQDPAYGGTSLAVEAPVGVVGPLGFKSRRIREGKTRTVYARTETAAFQPQSLFIPRRVARHFEIREISVGGICLLGGSSCAGIPAELYSNEGCAGPAFIQLPPIIPGMAVRLRVKNISDDSHRFRAALNGLFFY